MYACLLFTHVDCLHMYIHVLTKVYMLTVDTCLLLTHVYMLTVYTCIHVDCLHIYTCYCLQEEGSPRYVEHWFVKVQGKVIIVTKPKQKVLYFQMYMRHPQFPTPSLYFAPSFHIHLPCRN